MDLADARALWDPEPGWLNTASYGLPPRPAWDELQRRSRCGAAAPTAGSRGASRPSGPGGRSRGSCRSSRPGSRSAARSPKLLGMVAASLPDGARVVVPEVEFTSNLFPWLVQEDRGVQVVTVPTDRLLDEITPGTTLVATSLVQSADR